MKKSQTNKKSSTGLLTIRIVKVAALVFGTVMAPMYAQVAPTTDIRAETASFIAVGQLGAGGPESYVVPVSGAAKIAEVRQYLAERAAGAERRALIPVVRLQLGSDGENRNHSAPGTPLWPWHVAEALAFERFTRPEVEAAVIRPTADSTPSELENLLRGDPRTLPGNVVGLINFPIVMELKSEFPRSSMINISDRGFVGTGQQVKITGFIVEGGTPRNVLVRVLGPSLAPLGVTGVLANPRLEVYQGSEKIGENDDWATGYLGRIHPAVVPPPSPFHLIPYDAHEAAIVLTLAPGAYTVVVSGVNGGTGVALTEVYTL